MASVSPIPQIVEEGAAVGAPPAFARWAKLGAWLERMGERLNPILVKECRQSLKSRQFAITFALVLAACWLWSIFGVTLIGPSIYYSGAAAGTKMFEGYFFILAVALLIVVPFGAFRSLADERDDRTFELLAITTLRPRQIVAGKLGSAIIQMLVYLSAVSPCLGFTYLLRGIELPTILLALGYCLLTSVGLSILCLLAGTVALARQWYSLLSALMVLLLIGNFGFTISGEVGIVMGSSVLNYGSADFWHAVGGFLLAHVSYDTLFFLAATARLTFPSENRSTPLRIAMLSQHLLLTFAFAWFVTRIASNATRELAPMLIESLTPYCILLTIHWYVMGAFMTGETSQLSDRAKRGLPQSFVGRAILTWFTPGSATGYVFAVANLLAMTLVVHAVLLYVWLDPGLRMQATLSAGRANFDRTSQLNLLLFGYAAFYLGLGRIVTGALRRVATVRMAGAVMLNVLLVLVGCITPLLIEEIFAGRGRWSSGYSLLYVFNPFYSISSSQSSALSGQIELALVIVLGSASVVFLANLRAVAAELRRTRVAAPERVAEDDAALAVKPVAIPVTPWD